MPCFSEHGRIFRLCSLLIHSSLYTFKHGEASISNLLIIYHFQESLVVHLFISQIFAIAEECVCCDRRGCVLCLRFALQMNGFKRYALFLCNGFKNSGSAAHQCDM